MRTDAVKTAFLLAALLLACGPAGASEVHPFIGTGGMPSSHAAGATALATTCGMHLGFDSVTFALAAVFAMVTMFDAQGVRRSTGQQAEILNQIMDDIHWKGKIEAERLKELIGHTPIQVIIGAIIGCILAILFYIMW